MNLVTLTDHDTIAGGLQLIDRPDFFLSEEVTAAFPDKSEIHVLAWNITPAQHDRIQAARLDVNRLVELLRSEGIVHACAHPLFSPNGKLSKSVIEQILVLFPILEGINGLTDRRIEMDLHALLAGIEPDHLTALAARHGLPVPTHGRHVLSAGSDDHSLRHAATCYTRALLPGLGSAEFLAAVGAGETQCHGRHADLNVMHLTATHVTYGFLSARKLERPDYRDPFVDLIDVIGGREIAAAPSMGTADDFVRSLLAGAARSATPLGAAVDPRSLDDFGDEANERVMSTIRAVHDSLVGKALDELVDGFSDLDMYRMLGGLRDLAGAAATATPFMFAAHHYGKQRAAVRDVLAQWDASPRPQCTQRLAIFSDSLEQIDGVTTSLRRFVKRSIAAGSEVRIPYCGAQPPEDFPGVYLPLPAATTRATDLYDGMRFYIPSLLGTLDWLWRNEITHVELATPGPMGIIGLCAARLLALPVIASYHTELPELARHLCDHRMIHSLSRALVRWFYNATDRVRVFSDDSRRRLLELQVDPSRLERVEVAIDPDEFSPAFASSTIYESLGLPVHEGPVVLCVGRLSREKNLRLVIAAVERLRVTQTPPPVLVIVGEGPEGDALRCTCAKKPWVIFAGVQQGDTLRRLYASATAFVFASTIDTLGLVTMEAMASALPVLVPRGSAISELITHGRTGYCYELSAEHLAATLVEVLESPQRQRVARNARSAMVKRWNQASQAGLSA